MSHPLIPDQVPVTLEQLQAYHAKLSHHDWYYEYSDDHSVYMRGSKSLLECNLAAKLSPQHKALFDKFHAYYFDRNDDMTVKHALPPIPTSID